MNQRLFLILSVIVLFACNLPLPLSQTPTPTLTPAPPPFPPSSGDPGMVVRGRVTLNGAGLPGVMVYKRFNAYPRDLIAITDENGYYLSEFIPIPGDEMTSIEVELAGYTFDPPYHYWRHYHGYVAYTWDFEATAAP